MFNYLRIFKEKEVEYYVKKSLGKDTLKQWKFLLLYYSTFWQ